LESQNGKDEEEEAHGDTPPTQKIARIVNFNDSAMVLPRQRVAFPDIPSLLGSTTPLIRFHDEVCTCKRVLIMLTFRLSETLLAMRKRLPHYFETLFSLFL
jgi:hypothetical protein